MRALVLLSAAAIVGPALAQEGSTFSNPSPVNFDQPFLYDGISAGDRFIRGRSENEELPGEAPARRRRSAVADELPSRTREAVAPPKDEPDCIAWTARGCVAHQPRNPKARKEFPSR